MKHTILGLMLGIAIAATAIPSWQAVAALAGLVVSFALVLWDERSQRASEATAQRVEALRLVVTTHTARINEATDRIEAALKVQSDDLIAIRGTVASRR